MSGHNALPAEGDEPVKPVRPAAARWHRDEDGGRWLVKVRKSMHQPGRTAHVVSAQTDKLVLLGDAVAELDDTFMLCEFTDNTPKPPRGCWNSPSDKQVDRLRQLWSERGGGKFVATARHILAEPEWNTLTAAEASWYISELKAEVTR